MRAGAVPVTEDRLGLERGVDVELLGDAEEQPARHPQLVADERRRQDADLELPLPHHHLGVGALDRPARRPCTPACGARRSRGPASCRRRRRSSTGPAARGTRPRANPAAGRTGRRCTPARSRTTARTLAYFSAASAHARRVLVGCGVMSVSSTSHMTSLLSPPRSGSGHDEHRLQHAVRVAALGLVRARPVEAPDRGLLAVRDDLGLAPEQRARLGPVDPDVLGLVAHELSCAPLLVSCCRPRHDALHRSGGRTQCRRTLFRRRIGYVNRR